MKCITEEEARIYVPCSEDYYNDPPSFFTIYTDSDGWDIVTYYTNKKRGIYSGREGRNWVYVLSNPAMPGLLKIGHTKLDPYERSIQIGRGTGVPLDFNVEWAYKCINGEEMEREVHKYLKECRVNTQKEFFEITVDEAIKAITFIGSKYV
jgi:hypothetical protein